jgi:hypothetical protein
VSLVVRDVKALRHVVTQLKTLCRHVNLEANMGGLLCVGIRTEVVAVKTFFRGLPPQRACADLARSGGCL